MIPLEPPITSGNMSSVVYKAWYDSELDTEPRILHGRTAPHLVQYFLHQTPGLTLFLQALFPAPVLLQHPSPKSSRPPLIHPPPPLIPAMPRPERSSSSESTGTSTDGTGEVDPDTLLMPPPPVPMSFFDPARNTYVQGHRQKMQDIMPSHWNYEWTSGQTFKDVQVWNCIGCKWSSVLLVGKAMVLTRCSDSSSTLIVVLLLSRLACDCISSSSYSRRDGHNVAEERHRQRPEPHLPVQIVSHTTTTSIFCPPITITDTHCSN